MVPPDPDASRELQRELEPNERILWSGRPRQGLLLRGIDALLIPFSIMWGGFAFFWEFMALAKGPMLMKLWGIPFVLVGTYMIIGRFFWDAFTRSKCFYALTNTRILIVSGTTRRTVKSLQLNALPETTLSEGANGTGSITFGTSMFPQMQMLQGFFPGGRAMHQPAFQMIERVRDVMAQIREAQRSQ